MSESDTIEGGRAGETGVAAVQAEARQRLFVGRDCEIRQFRAVLERAELPRIFIIHGPGGIGKSAVLKVYASVASDLGVLVCHLDARDMRPAPSVLGRAVHAAFVRHSGAGTRVVAIVHYERIAALDGWLREQFVPYLPADTLLILAGAIGRNRPGLPTPGSVS